MFHTFMNVTGQGYVGSDPRKTEKTLKFDVSRKIKFTDRHTQEPREITKWTSVTVFAGTPGFDYLSQNLRSGDLVTIQGELENTKWEKDNVTHYGMTLNATMVAIVPTGKNNS